LVTNFYYWSAGRDLCRDLDVDCLDLEVILAAFARRSTHGGIVGTKAGEHRPTICLALRGSCQMCGSPSGTRSIVADWILIPVLASTTVALVAAPRDGIVEPVLEVQRRS